MPQQAAARMYENMRAQIELEELQLQQRRDIVSVRLRYEVSQAIRSFCGVVENLYEWEGTFA
eukprot:6210692-Pleurochrysis_carterae.AAC.1